jgi:hypothetical protein
MGSDAKEDDIGNVRDFTWTDYEPERRLCGLQIRYGRVNNKWMLIFDLSCDPDGRPPGVK